MLGVLLLLFVSPPSDPGPFANGVAAYRAGDYSQAAHTLSRLPGSAQRNWDYVLYFLGESQFYAGDYPSALQTFSRLQKITSSRFAPQMPYRRADCLWMLNRKQEAATLYQASRSSQNNVDPVVGRFHLAQWAEESASSASDPQAQRQAAQAAFLAIHVAYPAHPLGIAAGERAKISGDPAQKLPPPRQLTPAECLTRAEALAKNRLWQEVEAELQRLPSDLPLSLRTERDFALATAKYQSRSDYANAAKLFLDVSGRLGGERAAYAAFHGARALSRLDRDDEAIRYYQKTVHDFPASTWAPEAQFRSGWLDFNRGRFREAIPLLNQTIQRYSKSSFAAQAAWYLSLAHFLLGENTLAWDALGTYQKLNRTDEGRLRTAYFRGRILQKRGDTSGARSQFLACIQQSPFSYYGVLAKARLQEAKESLPSETALPPSPPPGKATDPLFLPSYELARAGLEVEAGFELAKVEPSILRRLGKPKAIPLLLSDYARFHAYRHAQRLAASIPSSPKSPLYRISLEASYPRAYAGDVVPSAQAFGVPELFVYAIMRKESEYHPFALSSADARGLLQLIPSTAQTTAQHLGQPFATDDLFEPRKNIALGVAYLGQLLRRFHGQEILAAGAYNAGAKAMMRWCDQWGKRPLDEFVELVTYDQAREYMKRVMAFYGQYQHLYGKPWVLPLTLNPNYLRDQGE